MKTTISKWTGLIVMILVMLFLLKNENAYLKNCFANYALSLIFPVQYYVEKNYVNCDYAGDPSQENMGVVEYIVLENDDEMISETMPENEVVETSTPVGTIVGNRLKEELLDFKSIVSNFYTVTSITELTEKQFDLQSALEASMAMEKNPDVPQILVFHTHSQEDFVDSIPGDASTTIVGVGEHLAQILREQYGYNVIHDTSVYDYVNGVLDRSKAYTYAERGIEQILEANPTIEVVLDIHRDGVDDKVQLKTQVNGKPTARFMFFNGISHTKVNGDIASLQNPYIQDNLALSLQMYLMGETLYPGLLRKNYINGYRYCLHFRPKSMLIEVGAQNNTLEEELNAMEPLADMLNRVLSGQKAYQ